MIRTKLSTVILHHNMVLCVQFQEIRMTGIRASQKEKDPSRLLYRICGSGSLYNVDMQDFMGNHNYYFFAGGGGQLETKI